jgi:hypothetical protein
MLYRREVSVIRRSNMVKRRGESWRPALFSASNSLVSRLTFALRRVFDLQASSIWHDLSVELPGVEGTALDVGCGAQPYRCLFSTDAEYIGIDNADAKSHFGYSMPDTR